MRKEDYIRLLVSEHWFSLKHWKGKDWGDKEKKIWISGMHRAWNMIYPDNQIEPLEIYHLREQWSQEEAEQWYTEYMNSNEPAFLSNVIANTLSGLRESNNISTDLFIISSVFFRFDSSVTFSLNIFSIA